MSRIKEISPELKKLFDEYYQSLKKQLYAHALYHGETHNDIGTGGLDKTTIDHFVQKMLYDYIYHYDGRSFISSDGKLTPEEEQQIRDELSRRDSYFKYIFVGKEDSIIENSIREMLDKNRKKRFEWPKTYTAAIYKMLKHPHIAKICEGKGIKVEELFKIDFSALCEKLDNIWKVGINPDEVIAECIAKGKTDLQIYTESKVNLVYRVILRAKKQIYARSLTEVITSEEFFSLLEKTMITEDEFEMAMINIQNEITHHRASNPFMDTIFDEFDLVRKLAEKPIYDFKIVFEIKEKGLEKEKFGFYENAKIKYEFSGLLESRKHILGFYQLIFGQPQNKFYPVEDKTKKR